MSEPFITSFKTSNHEHMLRWADGRWGMHFVFSDGHTQFLRELSVNETRMITGLLNELSRPSDIEYNNLDYKVAIDKISEQVGAIRDEQGRITFKDVTSLRIFTAKMQHNLSLIALNNS